MKSAIVCRSRGQQCGIAEHSRYLSKAMNADLVKSASQLRDSDYELIIVEHEYNLYLDLDDLNFEIELAQQKSKCVLLECHTALRRTYLDEVEVTKIVKSPMMASRLGNSVVVPEYIYPIPSSGKPVPQNLCVGTFGFASPARRMRELLQWGRKNDVDVKVIATINTTSEQQENFTRQYAESLKKEFGDSVISGFFTLEEVVKRLEDCSHLVFLRDGDPSLGISGAVHIAYNARRPIIMESKFMAPELDNVYVSRIEGLTREKLQTMTNIPSGGWSIERCVEKYFEIANQKGKVHVEKVG